MSTNDSNTADALGTLRRELVLVVDDDDKHIQTLSRHLSTVHLDVITARNAETGWKRCISYHPALIMTEIDLEDQNGFDLCRKLMAHPKTAEIPLVFVTGRDEEIDLVVGFELGATDYVTKPVNYRELALRTLRILKRVRGYTRDGEIRLGRLTIDLEQSIAVRNGERLNLSPTEFQILATLAKAKGRVLTRGEIIERAWRRQGHVMARTVDAHIKAIRAKLEDTGFRIVTIRRTGYCLRYSTTPSNDDQRGAHVQGGNPSPAQDRREDKLRESSGI